MRSRSRIGSIRRLVLATGIAGLAALAAAYHFALEYRKRAGLPHRSRVETTPADFGLAFEPVEIPSGNLRLAGWYVPASAGGKRASSVPRPAVVIIHGWESNRGRLLPHVRYLHAAGFHCLAIDVRNHGDSPGEELPISVPEFAADAAAAARWLAARPEVSAVGLLGHSMGGAGVIVAGATEPCVGAVIAVSAPADPVSMTRRSFELAEMHVPGLIATPLARLTAMVLLAPRGHSLADASAMVAAARYAGPLLLLHGVRDRAVPVEHLALIAWAARAARGASGSAAAPVETLVLPEFGHRWLYEAEAFRRKVASFLAESLGGPISPKTASERAAACVLERPANPIFGYGALGTGPTAAAAAAPDRKPRPNRPT
jgi:alpha-beta hydrolase superfamily lysophospholipase